MNAGRTPVSPRTPPAPTALRIANAEASVRPSKSERKDTIPALRAEGVAHALERNEFGIVLMSEANGVEGFMKSPSGDARADDVRWAGFVENDAILAVVGETLHRAESMQDARDGRFSVLPHRVDGAATLFAGAGGKVVAFAQSSPPRLFVSSDDAKTFSERRLPETTAIIDLAVRRDGLIVVAHDAGKTTTSWGYENQVAQIHVSQGAAWTKGPRSQSYQASSLIVQTGDDIRVSEPSRDRDGQEVHLARALAKNGSWVRQAAATRGYLDFAHPSRRFQPTPSVARPGYPSTSKPSDSPLSGVFGGLRMLGAKCVGVRCLAHRQAIGTLPAIEALSDGVCAASDTVIRRETIHVTALPGKPAHDEEMVHLECDPRKAALRTPALAMPMRDGPRVVRLPSSCASGEIIGTSRSPLLHCDGNHRGEIALGSFGDTGEIRILLWPFPKDEGTRLRFLGAESASDGTIVLFTDAGTLVADAPEKKVRRSVFVQREHLLAARPLPGGRALVARRGETDHDLVLDVIGEQTSLPAVHVEANVLEFEITAEGLVRLWTHPRQQYWGGAIDSKRVGELEALIVMSDGSLRRDEPAVRELRAELEGTRTKR